MSSKAGRKRGRGGSDDSDERPSKRAKADSASDHEEDSPEIDQDDDDAPKKKKKAAKKPAGKKAAAKKPAAKKAAAKKPAAKAGAKGKKGATRNNDADDAAHPDRIKINEQLDAARAAADGAALLSACAALKGIHQQNTLPAGRCNELLVPAFIIVSEALLRLGADDATHTGAYEFLHYLTKDAACLNQVADVRLLRHVAESLMHHKNPSADVLAPGLEVVAGLLRQGAENVEDSAYEREMVDAALTPSFFGHWMKGAVKHDAATSEAVAHIVVPYLRILVHGGDDTAPYDVVAHVEPALRASKAAGACLSQETIVEVMECLVDVAEETQPQDHDMLADPGYASLRRGFLKRIGEFAHTTTWALGKQQAGSYAAQMENLKDETVIAQDGMDRRVQHDSGSLDDSGGSDWGYRRRHRGWD